LIESIEELLREQSERARQRAVGSLITDSGASEAGEG